MTSFERVELFFDKITHVNQSNGLILQHKQILPLWNSFYWINISQRKCSSFCIIHVKSLISHNSMITAINVIFDRHETWNQTSPTHSMNNSFIYLFSKYVNWSNMINGWSKQGATQQKNFLVFLLYCQLTHYCSQEKFMYPIKSRLKVLFTWCM